MMIQRGMRGRTSADSLGAADASSSFFFGLFFFRRSGLGPLGVFAPAPFPEGFTMRASGRSGVTLASRAAFRNFCPEAPNAAAENG